MENRHVPIFCILLFARSVAAHVRGFQEAYGVPFYAISIQNELNFEEFYNSTTYPLSSQYIAALKAVRAAFDQYPDLRDIRLMGPEDLLGGDAYGMWQYGGLAGFTAYGKKSWMTETSGEDDAWLSPAEGFPNNGGWSIALKIHQALTVGRQSAWIYWTFAESDDGGGVAASALTNEAEGAQAPKYVAAKHFFRYIRPGAYRVGTTVSGAEGLEASAYVHDEDATLTIVLVNATAEARTTAVTSRMRQAAASSSRRIHPVRAATGSPPPFPCRTAPRASWCPATGW